MRLLLLLLVLFAAPAQAQLQFESSSTATPSIANVTPGIAWLQQKPATLFDIGMMELTEAANKAASSMFDATGAIAEYRAEKGLLAISFYVRTAYSETNCDLVVKKLRDKMFPKRDDVADLGADLASYFSSYGPTPADQPAGIGTELVKITRFAVYMPGGVCQLPLYGSDETSYWKDPNAPVPQAPTQELPQLPQSLAPATPPAHATPATRSRH